MKLSDANQLQEFIRYSPYGVPTSFPRGDYDLDGDVDAADTTALGNFIAGGSYGWNLDFNGDGVADSNDTDEHAAYVTGYDKGLGGRTVLSRSGVRNRAGLRGLNLETSLGVTLWCSRGRDLNSELGTYHTRRSGRMQPGHDPLPPMAPSLPIVPPDDWFPTPCPPGADIACRGICNDQNKQLVRPECFEVPAPGGGIRVMVTCVCGEYYAPGRCTVARHRQLQNDVAFLCQNYSCGSGGIGPLSSCSSFMDRARQGAACAAARRRINDECFAGGDRAHQLELQAVVNATNNCLVKYQECLANWDRWHDELPSPVPN